MANLIGTKEGSGLVFMRQIDGVLKTIKYDFKDNSFYSQTKKGNWRQVLSVYSFFKGISSGDVLRSFEDETYRKFLEVVVKATPSRLSNMSSMMEWISKLQHFETYIVLGIKFDTPTIQKGYYGFSVGGLKKPVNVYSKEVLEFIREGNFSINSNFEEIYTNENTTNKEFIDKLCRHIRSNYHMDLEVYEWAWNLFRYTWEMAKLTSLSNVYGLEYKTAFNYLVEVDRREALAFNNAITYLKDYLEMNQQMGNRRAPRYPDNLTMRHNITARNHRIRSSNYDLTIFKSRVDHSLEWMDKDFAVVAPLNPEEMKVEGQKLHHCVASYIRKVMDGHCQILFLRDLEDGNEPLLTLEILNGKIVQYRGDNNRAPNAKEVEVLYKYAKAKRLYFKNYDPSDDIKADAKKEAKKGEDSSPPSLDTPA